MREPLLAGFSQFREVGFSGFLNFPSIETVVEENLRLLQILANFELCSILGLGSGVEITVFVGGNSGQ